MSITSDPWPTSSADLSTLRKLITFATMLKPGWQPPPTFAYSGEPRTADFSSSTAVMRSHIGELKAALPPGALLMFHALTVGSGQDYALWGWKHLKDLVESDPQLAGLAPELKKLYDALYVVNDVKNTVLQFVTNVYVVGTPAADALKAKCDP